MPAELTHARVGELLLRFGDASPLPGAGVAAALTAASAAGLVEMASRASADGGWDASGAVTAQAKALRRRLTALAEDNLETYVRARAALDDARTRGPLADAAELGQVMANAGGALLLVAGGAADVVALADEVVDLCNPDLRADVVAAVVLAEAALRAAAVLARSNLVAGSVPFGDDQLAAIEHSSALALRRIAAPV